MGDRTRYGGYWTRTQPLLPSRSGQTGCGGGSGTPGCWRPGCREKASTTMPEPAPAAGGPGSGLCAGDPAPRAVRAGREVSEREGHPRHPGGERLAAPVPGARARAGTHSRGCGVVRPGAPTRPRCGCAPCGSDVPARTPPAGPPTKPGQSHHASFTRVKDVTGASIISGGPGVTHMTANATLSAVLHASYTCCHPLPQLSST